MSLWRILHEWPVYAGMVIGAVLGAALAWILASPPPPWLAFEQLHAVYEPGSTHIDIYGRYRIYSGCVANRAGPPSWRLEAVAPNGRVMLYGPAPKVPELTENDFGYSYMESLPLSGSIDPTGWKVYILVRCDGQTPSLVSSDAIPVETSTDDIPGPR